MAWKPLSSWVMDRIVAGCTLDKLRGASQPFEPLLNRMVICPSQDLLETTCYGIDKPTISFKPVQRIATLTYAPS